MSTTITTNKQAAAFRKSDGQVIYLMSEQTYESNVYPHTPRWSVTAFGTRNDVLRRIFQHARSCEGGMLASRAGTPVDRPVAVCFRTRRGRMDMSGGRDNDVPLDQLGSREGYDALLGGLRLVAGLQLDKA